MGNNPTKQSRSGDGGQHPHLASSSAHSGRIHNLTHSRSNRHGSSVPSSSLQHQSSHQQQQQHQNQLHHRNSNQENRHPQGRRLTPAERKALRIEKELELRKREREYSLKHETVDGGYLVTLGTYSLSEDFNKVVVRRLIIERRLAPFWRGLEDLQPTWTEHQLIAAANGLPIPKPDEIPSDDLLTQATSLPGEPESRSRSLSTHSPAIFSELSSNQTSRDRAVTLSSPASSHLDASMPQEFVLPNGRFHNGQRIEVFLYKQAEECPICFLYYPPYLNKTRCCDQPICTECFVQIKRADPHPPEHTDPSTSSNEDEPQLVTEPTCCPFCQTSMFGVYYEPPPFRYGLGYVGHAYTISPNAPVTSGGDRSMDAATAARRRAGSLSAEDPLIITSDHIRPDWERKLLAARAKVAQRSATATAIHTAALLMANPSIGGAFSLRDLRNSNSQRGPQTVDDLLMEIAIRMSLTEPESSGAAAAGGAAGDHPPSGATSREPSGEPTSTANPATTTSPDPVWDRSQEAGRARSGTGGAGAASPGSGTRN